jgi:hypothetical protein
MKLGYDGPEPEISDEMAVAALVLLLLMVLSIAGAILRLPFLFGGAFIGMLTTILMMRESFDRGMWR